MKKIKKKKNKHETPSKWDPIIVDKLLSLSPTYGIHISKNIKKKKIKIIIYLLIHHL